MDGPGTTQATQERSRRKLNGMVGFPLNSMKSPPPLAPKGAYVHNTLEGDMLFKHGPGRHRR